VDEEAPCVYRETVAELIRNFVKEPRWRDIEPG
jgi:hypothetical protein